MEAYWRHVLREGAGVRRPVSHALGCFRSLVVRVLRHSAVCCHLRFGCNCSPAPWSQPMILGGFVFDAFLLRCVRLYAAYCAFWMLCGTRHGTRASNVCVLTSVALSTNLYDCPRPILRCSVAPSNGPWCFGHPKHHVLSGSRVHSART